MTRGLFGSSYQPNYGGQLRLSGAIVFPSRSIDLDGDGLPNEFDHEPLKPNTNYMRFRSGPQDLSNVVEVMRTLGHVNPSPGSKDGETLER